jgi:predicted unusual protein kinase regulating ubiquinone biosynthesis (AarF/ABC1/UbiB family)
MEYVPGIKISDVSAIDAAGIDRKVRPCLLHMME